MIALREAECCALAGTDCRPPPLRRRAGRPQLKRDPLGGDMAHDSGLMVLYNIWSILGWFGAPVLLPAAVSVVYFRLSPPDQSLRDRLLISAHGVLISASYLGAMGV